MTDFEYEPLDPELKKYDWHDGNFRTIKHPLVFSVMHNDHLNKHVNKQLKGKKELLEKAYDQGDWRTYIWLHERPYRIEAFEEIRPDLPDEEHYWSLLREVWIDSENIYQWGSDKDLRKLLVVGRNSKPLNANNFGLFDPNNRPGWLTPTERRWFAARKSTSLIKMFRGHGEKNQWGWSWTGNEKTARWFATRFSSVTEKAFVTRTLVPLEFLIAVFDSRQEFEIIIDPLVAKDKQRKYTQTLELSPRSPHSHIDCQEGTWEPIYKPDDPSTINRMDQDFINKMFDEDDNYEDDEIEF